MLVRDEVEARARRRAARGSGAQPQASVRPSTSARARGSSRALQQRRDSAGAQDSTRDSRAELRVLLEARAPTACRDRGAARPAGPRAARASAAAWTTRTNVTCARRSDSVEPDRSNSGSSSTSTPVSRASRSALAGCAPSSSFESSPIPSALSPPPIRSAETSRTDGACSRIWRERLLVRVEVVLRDEAEAADEPERVLAEALGETVRSTRAPRSSAPRTDRGARPSRVASRSR